MALMSSCACFDIVAIITTLVVLAIAYLKWKLSYWERRGVPTLDPKIPFGDTKDLFFGRASFGEQFQQLYQKLKARNLKFGGAYLGPNPVVILVDPEIVKHIMQIDFSHFLSHGGYVNEECDPLSLHLFNLTDAKWRNLRVKLTPTFTSGKMKMMFQTVLDCGRNLKEVIEEAASSGSSVDARDVLGRFGTDVIGSVAFGLDIKSLKNPDDVFRHYGKRAVEIDMWDTIRLFMQIILPHWFLNAIGHKFTKADVEKFFMKVIRDTVEYREKNNIYRKDFMHLLLQLKNRGTVEDDDKITDEDGKIQEKGLNMNELSAQAYVFFMAGYETSSTTVSFALCELAENPDLQDKLRNEINSVLAKHNNQLTYEAITEMTYMDKVLFETLRKHPPLPIFTRECTKDYIMPNTSIEIKKGMGVIIPVLGLQRDPDYYPNPEIFDPERFSEENKQLRPGFTWMPFGDGPRICIGMRFGILQSKVGLVTTVGNYKITIGSKTKLPLQHDKRSFVTKADGGIWLDFEKV